MMHIAICEDEACYREALESAIARWADACGHPDVSVRAFPSSEDLLECWQRGMPIDLLFTDIQIPGELDGMALARRIRERDAHMSIVFVTHYAHYVFDGYAVQALRYLQKPVSDQALFSCLELAFRQFQALHTQSPVLSTPEARLVLRHAELRFVEVRSHYLLFSTEGQQAARVRARLSEFLDRLPTPPFVQCHRSYVVNLAHIRRFTRNSLLLTNGQTLPVSQTHYPALSAAFERYYGEGNA